ncbi:hypothetical protein ISCGN_032576 [Ixodes scapularis]
MSLKESSSTALGDRVSQRAAESSQEYRIILPRLPSGMLVTNSLFLHADMTGRPYKATDFKDVLFSIIDRKDLIGLGPYQMSHVWMAVFANGAAKLKIKACEELLVKQKRCLIIDPCKEEIKLKLLWLPIPLPDSEIKKVLEPFGTVKDIKRERWRFSDLEETETLTRVVTLVLKEHLTVDKVPHTLTIFGVNTLVVIPGRPPLCLRCKSIGHIRRQCRTPQCHNCWRYGHESEECVVTYASKLLGKSSPEADDNEHIMDVEEMCNNDDCSTQDPPDTHWEITMSDAEVSEHLSGEQTPNVDKEVCPVQGLQASLDDDVPAKKSPDFGGLHGPQGAAGFHGRPLLLLPEWPRCSVRKRRRWWWLAKPADNADLSVARCPTHRDAAGGLLQAGPADADGLAPFRLEVTAGLELPA